MIKSRVNPRLQWILIDNLLLIAGLWSDRRGPECAGRVASVRCAAETRGPPPGPQAPTAHQSEAARSRVRQLASGPDSVYKPNIQTLGQI